MFKTDLNKIIKNNRVVGTWEGGYKPEEQGALKDDKGNIMYDEYGQIKKEETFLQKNVPLIQEQIKKLSGDLQTANRAEVQSRKRTEVEKS